MQMTKVRSHVDCDQPTIYPSSSIANLARTVIYFDPYTKRSYTYAQVKATAENFGKGLKALWDWQKGDVLALYTPNCTWNPSTCNNLSQLLLEVFAARCKV